MAADGGESLGEAGENWQATESQVRSSDERAMA